MNHAQIRELLALRLYGEIESGEAAALAEHLDACSACAHFARELEDGLGRARAAQTRDAEANLPPGWDAALADTTARLRRRSWAREALLVGSGLAAGVLAMLAWSSFSAPGAKPSSLANVDPDAPAFLRFQGDKPPPLATGGGPEAHYRDWQAR